MGNTKKTCIITGANSGIGRRAVVRLLEGGCRVVMVCRSEERGQGALEEIRSLDSGFEVELQVVDMGELQAVRRFAQRVEASFERIDSLIHNAAVFEVTEKRRRETSEGIEQVWAVNHLGPVLMTELLLGTLAKSDDARVLTVSSKGLLAMPFLKVDMDDPEFEKRKYSPVKAYYQSKLAQVMYTLWLAKRFEGTNVKANSIRVPAVRVDTGRLPVLSKPAELMYRLKSRMALSPEDMATTYAHLATCEDLRSVSGKYFDEQIREVSPRAYCRDERNIAALIALTARYLPEIQTETD